VAGGRAPPARVLPRPRPRAGVAGHAHAGVRGRPDGSLPQEAREMGGRPGPGVRG
jgi:hypothetical protein